MNDWGLPDWRDAAAYPTPTPPWNWFRWRWEFYRRRDDLRQAFDERAAESYQRAIEFEGSQGVPPDRVIRPDQAGFSAQAYTTDEFGYWAIFNPRISEQPHYALSSVEPRPGSIRIYGGWKEDEVGDWADPRKIGIRKTSEVLIAFDLDRPISEQIESAKHELAKRQRRQHGKVLQRRSHKEKWLGYLRTLDAREAGASWAEIAALHPKTAQPEQTARDIWEAASALRFNF